MQRKVTLGKSDPPWVTPAECDREWKAIRSQAPAWERVRKSSAHSNAFEAFQLAGPDCLFQILHSVVIAVERSATIYIGKNLLGALPFVPSTY